jgi:NAD(P)H dehydrogenase (quinone)
MLPININALIVFYSRYGNAERLALAAAVGAIRARANIRLRRVADLADAATIEADAAWRENLARMNMDYVVPRPADPVWADVIVLATPADSPAALETYLATLPSIGPMGGKIGAPLAPGNRESALKPIYAAAAWAGLIVVPGALAGGDPTSGARAFGERVIQMAHALKDGRERSQPRALGL